MTENQDVHTKNWLPFEKAREYAQSLTLNKRDDWFNFCKERKLPDNIPRNPDYVYKKNWKSWGNWLGTGRISPADRNFRPFQKARMFIHSLKLKNKQEWNSYSKSESRPIDIPANPPRTYAKEWKGWGDFLGTGTIANQKRIYLPFEKAKKSAQSLRIKSSMQWREYYTAGRIPKDIPSHPDRVYRKYWKGWAHWLGASNVSIRNKNFNKEVFLNENKKWIKFETARAFVNKLGLKTRFDWKLYSMSGKKPDNLPQYPSFIYHNEWKGWSDWLGNSDFKIKVRPFIDAKRYARALKLNSKKEWVDFCNSGNKSPDIPVSPESVYKGHWKGWGDWLGTGIIANMKRTFLPFKESRKFAQSLKLRSSSEWEEYRLKTRLPKDIPTHPERSYSKEWKGWGDWLGTVTLREIKFRPFQEARRFVQLFKFPNRNEFVKFCRTKERPKDIPANPSSVYAKEWKGWGDWLGTGIIATWKREYLPFEKAREFVRSLNLQSDEDWRDYVKSGKKPDSIPAAPWNTYKKDWMGIFDWLGYEGKHWSPGKVKELLKALIDSRIIYNWDEAVLYSFLLRKGLLNLHNNRHADFFKHLVQLTRTQEGRKLIEDYVNSNEENPPVTGGLSDRPSEIGDELETVSTQDLATSFDNDDPLDMVEQPHLRKYSDKPRFLNLLMLMRKLYNSISITLSTNYGNVHLKMNTKRYEK